MDDLTPALGTSGTGLPNPSRRQVLVTGGVVVAAVAVTAACGSSTPSASSTGRSGSTIPTGDVPVGGGQILTDQKVVVTQPAAGTFNAFTAVCTHQGCLVTSVSDGLIECPCHGSKFSIEDGSVQAGPAPAPLATVPITVSGSTITLT